MPVLDTVCLAEQGTSLIVVFLPPETTFFHDGQRSRLRDLLIQTLLSAGLSGELIALWEFEGELHYMSDPRWHPFIEETGYASFYARRNRQITCE